MRPKSKFQRVAALLAQGKKSKAIAGRLGISVQDVYVISWRLKNRERYLAVNTARRRRRGHRPRKEVQAERSAASEARLAKIQPLLDKGLSWGKAAAKLGISRNVIAGLTWKQKRRASKAA